MWVWVNSRSWWWTGRPGMLWFMGLQRVGHNWVTELNWFEESHLTPQSLSFLSSVSEDTPVSRRAVCWVWHPTSFLYHGRLQSAFPGGARGKEPSASAGDVGDAVSIPGSGRSPGEGNGNPLHYSCLDRGTWQATVHGVAKSRTRLSDSARTCTTPHIFISTNVSIFNQN